MTSTPARHTVREVADLGLLYDGTARKPAARGYSDRAGLLDSFVTRGRCI